MNQKLLSGLFTGLHFGFWLAVGMHDIGKQRPVPAPYTYSDLAFLMFVFIVTFALGAWVAKAYSK